MGSLRTSKDRRERLAQLDCSPAEISQLHGPIGLDIGSKKPAEIAISIIEGIKNSTEMLYSFGGCRQMLNQYCQLAATR